MGLTKKKRAEVFAMFGGRCAYCGCLLSPKRWHADHIEPVYRWKKPAREQYDFSDDRFTKVTIPAQTGMHNPENDRADNYFPSCLACNIDKSAMRVEHWREWIADKPEVLRRNYSAFRHAERFGLVQVTGNPVIFYFERFLEQEDTCPNPHSTSVNENAVVGPSVSIDV